jgi:hypothetical protein
MRLLRRIHQREREMRWRDREQAPSRRRIKPRLPWSVSAFDGLKSARRQAAEKRCRPWPHGEPAEPRQAHHEVQTIENITVALSALV